MLKIGEKIKELRKSQDVMRLFQPQKDIFRGVLKCGHMIG